MYSTDNDTTTHVDVVGDVHGCYDELLMLVTKLGYLKGDDGFYRHPEGRHLAFVGDLTDRGPKNRKALLFALRHSEAGVASYVQGNHDNKLGRCLKGNDVFVGHGLQDTLDELQDMSPDAKSKLSERLLKLPLYATFDSGRLLVVHAAAPPEGVSKGKVFSTCLYGHTTGRKTALGFPERLDWAPSYNRNATPETPFVVYGHVTHQEAYVTDHTCCIDTACFAGNKLSAFRWPEREVVSVDSLQDKLDTPLVGHSTPSKEVSGLKPTPVTHMYLPSLLDAFLDRGGEILQLVDEDPDLKIREHENGLVIANASPALFEPEFEHQLFAKGLVYTREPYRLVSMPLVKMFNHTRRDPSDMTTKRLLEMSGVTVRYPEKADGTLIQVFAHLGEVYITTRSMLEGTLSQTELTENFDYIGHARRILGEKYPVVLNAEDIEGYSLMFEMIHPESRIVTDYGDTEDMILLAAFDLETCSYKSCEALESVAGHLGLNVTKFYEPDTGSFDGDIAAIIEDLDAREDMPEGIIVVFEEDGQVSHRVKVKTQAYLRYHRLKFHCTFKSVVQMVWSDESLHEWDSFLDYLQTNGLTEEEVESFYKEHFDEFKVWLADVQATQDSVSKYLEDFNQTSQVSPSDKGAYFKALAIKTKVDGPDIFSLVMQMARSQELPLVEVMRARPAYDGFKGLVDTWKKEQTT